MFNEIYQTESGDLFQGMSSEVFGKALQHASYADIISLRSKKYRGTMVLEKASVQSKLSSVTREGIHAKLTRIEAMIAKAEEAEKERESQFQERLSAEKAKEQERLSAEKAKQQEELFEKLKVENDRKLFEEPIQKDRRELEREARRLFIEEIKRRTGLT